eukprot:1002739-Amphidinium_carterae.1
MWQGHVLQHRKRRCDLPNTSYSRYSYSSSCPELEAMKVETSPFANPFQTSGSVSANPLASSRPPACTTASQSHGRPAVHHDECQL